MLWVRLCSRLFIAVSWQILEYVTFRFSLIAKFFTYLPYRAGHFISTYICLYKIYHSNAISLGKYCIIYARILIYPHRDGCDEIYQRAWVKNIVNYEQSQRYGNIYFIIVYRSYLLSTTFIFSCVKCWCNNTARHTVLTIVTWPNHEQCLMIHIEIW